MAVGFYVNIDSCIGCRTCQVACKDRHNIQIAGPRLRRVDSYEAGEYPEAGTFHTSISCNHCDSPACTAACPTGAMYKDEATGVVLHDDDVCIRCQACVNACPYGAPQENPIERTMVKCDMCAARQDRSDTPACVLACPMKVLSVMDREEAEAMGAVREGAGLVQSETNPNLWFVPAKA